MNPIKKFALPSLFRFLTGVVLLSSMFFLIPGCEEEKPPPPEPEVTYQWYKFIRETPSRGIEPYDSLDAGTAARTYCYRARYDHMNQLVQLDYFDRGQPAPDPNFFVQTIQFIRSDDHVLRLYRTHDDKPMKNRLGVYAEELDMDHQNGILTVRNMDQYNRPVMDYNNVYTYRCIMDDHGFIESQFHWDSLGIKVENIDGVYEIRWTRSAEGYPVQERYLNNVGSLAPNIYNVAIVRRDFDDYGRLMQELYLGIDLDPVLNPAVGYWKARYTYDDRGNRIREAYFAPDNEPIEIREGYSHVVMEYDQYRNVILRKEFDRDGNLLSPVIDNAGSQKDTSNVQKS